jgi:GT2 family glycosyltransferase
MISTEMPNPMHLKGMKEALDRIWIALQKKEKIAIFGDYDVDGATSTALLSNYFSEIEKKYGVRVILDQRKFNYSAINNSSVNFATGELIALVNNDIEVISEDWLSELVSLALQPGVGAVGAKLLYPNRTIQHAGVITGIGGVAGHSHKYFDMNAHGFFSRAQLISSFSAVTAACLVVNKSIFLEVGGLDETNLAIAFNDVDLCLKIRQAGYRNIWTPYAVLYHHESATRGVEDSPEKKLRFSKEVNFMKEKWGDSLLKDPAYNPNLTLDHEDFSYAWPPRI